MLANLEKRKKETFWPGEIKEKPKEKKTAAVEREEGELVEVRSGGSIKSFEGVSSSTSMDDQDR